MSGIDLQALWQSEDEGSFAFSPRELASRPAPEPAVTSQSVDFLEQTLEAHGARTLWRLQLVEHLATRRALRRLAEATGRALPQRRPVLVAVAATAAVGLVATAGLLLAPTPKIAARTPEVQVPPAQELEELLAECRTFSDPLAANWPRARAACERALELEPLDREANGALKRIAVLETCQAHVEDARAKLALGQAEAALDELFFVGADCETYLVQAHTLAHAPLEEVKKKTGEDCALYAKHQKWGTALLRCERYMRLACQAMSPVELTPPPLLALKLEGPLNPKTEWRPADPRFVDFLRARARVAIGQPAWVCPLAPALQMAPAAPDPDVVALAEFGRRYAEPELGRALGLYFQGRFDEAPVVVQKVLETMSKAPHHEAARALLSDLQLVIALFKQGNTELLAGSLARAVAPFEQALALDEALVLGPQARGLSDEERRRRLDRGRTSALRRQLVQGMATASYERGKVSADRKDFRAACKVWKLGLSFSRAHLDLLRAASNVCTPRAQEAWERAERCEQLTQVLDFAVDGDGFREKATASMEERGCPPTP